MNTCETCMWWGQEPNQEFEWRKVDMDSNQKYQQCGCPKFDYGYRIPFKDVALDGAIIESDEGWGWFTGALFGCIHHEVSAVK